ncbi:MAG: VanW family protein [Actinobacteria bacterium]|nr:VanW family protein [Actinomycetota bacterium]
MKTHPLFRVHPLLAAVIVSGAVFAILFGLYGLNRWISTERVIGRVVVGDVSIGGRTEDEARVALVALEEELVTRPAQFVIEGQLVTLMPPEAGLDVDDEGLLEDVMALGREGNMVYQFVWWLSHIFKTVRLPVLGDTDPQAMEAVLDHWDSEVISEPVNPGAVVLQDGAPAPIYPETGIGLDRTEAVEIIEASLLSVDPNPLPLPSAVIVPQLTDADIDAAVAEAVQLLSEPISLLYDGRAVTFDPGQLVAAYVATTITESSPQIVHSFNPEVIDTYLDPVRAEYEAEPVDARFEINGDLILIIPGSKGTRIDESEAAMKLLQAGFTSGRVGALPLVEDADPDVTTEELEALGIEQLVSSFTTFHACCENRVVNIQLMADAVDMAIVLPGRQFSLNGFVGQRTPEKGYLPAPTIIAGELEDTIGGGVSQFATTMYNAVYWGGYQDVEHKPHSYSFNRYPEGIEATINWRVPDLVFRNDTDKAILIDTQYTDNSITIRIFGDNDARTVKGEHRGGQTTIDVISGGGPDAVWVESSVSDRFAITGPPPPQYRGVPGFGLEQVHVVQEERTGWSVTVTRRLLLGGNDLISEQTWTVVYLPQPTIYEVHPCKVPGREATCPTTTTIPPSTTTSGGTGTSGG